MAARSPNYPSLSLPEAIEGIEKVHKADTVSKVSREAVAKHLGYQVLSGPATQKIAALKAYNLLEGRADELRVSADAVTIIADPVSSPDRQQAIRAAAFKPKLFSEIDDYFEGARPSEENLRSYLLKKGFRTDTAGKAVSSYLETFGLVSREGMAHGSQHKHANGAPSDFEEHPEIGDLIQWESNGVLRLEKPLRVRAIEQHEGKSWVFVEGHESGIPMEQAILTEKGRGGSGEGHVVPPVLPLESLKEEREWLRGPLSRDASYRIIVRGDVGAREIGKLIRLLEAQKEILNEEDVFEE